MSDRDGKLREYREKRDFDKTPEPGPAAPAPDGEEEQRPRVFVIQKHDASRLHYDFRLEVQGVLKSWVVPKGPSLSPKDKRLAVMTEDHPLAYASFEGSIPEGEYGGGAVIVWDHGTYRNLKLDDTPPQTMPEALASGHVLVWLEGQKLRGGFALIHTAGRRPGDEDNWLLIKKSDERAQPGSDIVGERPESVVTGRVIEDVKGGA